MLTYEIVTFGPTLMVGIYRNGKYLDGISGWVIREMGGAGSCCLGMYEGGAYLYAVLCDELKDRGFLPM